MAPPPERALEELERQVERGSVFTNAVLQRGFARLDHLETYLSALIDVLEAKGVASTQELVDFVEAPPAPAAERTGPAADAPVPNAISWPSIALRSDPDDEDLGRTTQRVDCAERMHVCHAVCCKLKFPLSEPEVEARVVKWDVGHPYVIRQDADGYCSHNDRATGGCGVYADRPRVCRRYSCADDPRIWKDFEAMVLNEEWIAEHTGPDAAGRTPAPPPRPPSP